MGDITASSEASRQPVSGLLYDSRVAGGILADGQPVITFPSEIFGLIQSSPAKKV